MEDGQSSQWPFFLLWLCPCMRQVKIKDEHIRNNTCTSQWYCACCRDVNKQMHIYMYKDFPSYYIFFPLYCQYWHSLKYSSFSLEFSFPQISLAPFSRMMSLPISFSVPLIFCGLKLHSICVREWCFIWGLASRTGLRVQGCPGSPPSALSELSQSPCAFGQSSNQGSQN